MARSSWGNWRKAKWRKFPRGCGASNWASAAKSGITMTRHGKTKRSRENRLPKSQRKLIEAANPKPGGAHEKQETQAAAGLCCRNQGCPFGGNLRGPGAGARPQQAAQGAAAIPEPERGRGLASQRRRQGNRGGNPRFLSGKI